MCRWIDPEIKRLLEYASPTRPQVLEIGCGDGWLLESYADRADVTGVEPDPQMISESPRRQWIQHRSWAAGPPEPAPPRQDIVFMFDVLEHIEDEPRALREIHDVLKPGGVLVMSVPACPGLWSDHDVVNNHFRRYTREGLKTALMDSGLQVEQCHALFAWLLLPLWFRKQLRPARGAPPNGPRSPESLPALPGPALNALLLALSRVDHRICASLNLGSGTTLLAVARKQSE